MQMSSSSDRPFQLSSEELRARLDEMVKLTFGDLQSQFLVLPRGDHYVEFHDFQDAFETLKRHTGAFEEVTDVTLLDALVSDALAFVVLRTILGFSPPEWAELARSELGSDVGQGMARALDVRVRHQRDLFQKLSKAVTREKTYNRVLALLTVAARCIQKGAPVGSEETVHRLKKVDTDQGLVSLRHAADAHVPYAVLLYERYLGRPFASHRDSVSELVGGVMESAIAELLSKHKVTYRTTRRAERVPGFEQAPDFFVPSEFDPAVIIEAKITNDDGTARDKVARLKVLAAMRDQRIRKGEPAFEVVACIDGRGFGVRTEDMRSMLLCTHGKVFTLATLPSLLEFTRLRDFVAVK